MSGLLILWALLLGMGIWVGHWALLASSLVLVVVAVRDAWTLRATPLAGYARWIAAGMTLGALGDVGMGISVLVAMVPFALGHVAYIVGMLRAARQAGVASVPVRALTWAVWLGIGFLVWHHCVLNGEGTPAAESTALVNAGLCYTLFLASTSGAAWGLAVATRRFFMPAIGAALFLASDAVIAARMFRPALLHGIPEELWPALVWLTYGPAQMLLVTSVRGAAARLVLPAGTELE